MIEVKSIGLIDKLWNKYSDDNTAICYHEFKLAIAEVLCVALNEGGKDVLKRLYAGEYEEVV